MYSSVPSFVLGFHGCDTSVCEKVINGKDKLKSSINDYDWLGNGIYFWENDPDRALEYAKLLQKFPKRTKSIVERPAVIGAIIDLGHCLNLLDSKSLIIVKTGYELLINTKKNSGRPLPQNQPISQESDLLLRKLDCAVIETIHTYNEVQHQKEYDTVREYFGKEMNYTLMRVLNKKTTYKYA